MQPRKRERQTDQTPLACGVRFPAQRELAKAQYLFDDANHGFDRAFAQPVDHLAERRLEFIRHLLARTRVVAGGCRQRRKAFVPTRVMRITPGGNVRLNPALLTRLNICGAKIPIVHRARFRWPDPYHYPESLFWIRRVGDGGAGRIIRYMAAISTSFWNPFHNTVTPGSPSRLRP